MKIKSSCFINKANISLDQAYAGFFIGCFCDVKHSLYLFTQ